MIPVHVVAFVMLASAALVSSAPDQTSGNGADSKPLASSATLARERGERFERAVTAMDRLMRAWLSKADPRTLLLPDFLPGRLQTASLNKYTPHNSGADLYPYLVLTAELTDPTLFEGRMLEMLRNEIRYTNAEASIPGDLDFVTGTRGPMSLFGAGEYAKDGLMAITEYLGRTPWYFRMVDMTAAAMERAPVESKFGKLPASDSELNGDYLQVLARIGPMTGDQRLIDWARRIGDAYIEEVLPGTNGMPSTKWDFAAHRGEPRVRLRDHGNELVVGLIMQYVNEHHWNSERARTWRPAIAHMLDQILRSANADGLLYNEIDASTLQPVSNGLADNWGYVYGAVYAFYQCTGEVRYREAVLKALRGLPKYRRYVWEPRNDKATPLGSFDGYADTIEGAIYLVAREPVAEVFDWIESETAVMLDMQKEDGHIEYWYGEGNFNRTAMLYALMQSRGVRPAHWRPGMRVGAVQEGDRLTLSLDLPAPSTIRFDYARHRRMLNTSRNYVRLNEFPEWFVVDENTLYDIRPAAGATETGMLRLGSELIRGVELSSGVWTVAPFRD